jgi:methanogenic corrinoid protein MtbC1
MSKSVTNALSQQYLEPLLVGDRDACRACIDQALSRGIGEYDLLIKLIWPTMELIQTLYREDRISQSTLNLATRLNRTITDQLAAKLPRHAANGRKVMIFCGDDEPEELGGQLGADLFAPDAASAVAVANENPTKRASFEQQTVGRTRRIRKAQARKDRQQARGSSANAA